LKVVGITQGVLSLIGSYYLIGFLYAVTLVSISILLIGCEGLFSRESYIGAWCNVCRCCGKERSVGKLVFSIIFRVIYCIMIILSALLAALQIVNIVNNPSLKTFPPSCPAYDTDTVQIPCLRLAKDQQATVNELSRDFIFTYSLHNGGVTQFREKIFDCIANRF
jgi:hypothetical protein